MMYHYHTPKPVIPCDLWCNVSMFGSCDHCGQWKTHCWTHQRPGKHNRCTCVGGRE